MVIYLDVILIYTFLFNGAILLLVSYILKRKQPKINILFGTIIATMFVPLILYFPQTFINTFLGKSIYSILIVIVTFGVSSLRHVLKNLVTFYSVSFIAGGSLLSIHYLIEHSKPTAIKSLLLYVENLYGDQISLVIVFIGFPLTLFFTKLWSDKLITDHFEYEQQYKITLQWNGFTHDTIGFLDSGNQLVDPLTNRPVVVCDSFFMKQFFTTSDWTSIKTAIEENNLNSIPFHLYHQFSIVPFKTIAGDNHYLFAIKPDKLIVQTHDKHFVIKKVLVGIQMSNMTNDDYYHCLLHPQLVTLQCAE